MNGTDGANRVTRYRSIDVAGIDVAYREAGAAQAPVVLLLHGFPTSSRMFRDLIPRLSDRYRVIAPDYPGFGHSGVPDRANFAYNFDNLTAVVERLLDRLDVGAFTPYLMDFGGPVGCRLALKYPDRVPALVMQNAPLYPEPPQGWWETLGRYWKEGTGERRDESRSYLSLDSLRDQYLHGVRDGSLIDPDNWIVDAALIGRPGVDEIMLDLLYDIHNNTATFSAMRQFLRDRRPPTLVATGANDEIFPEEVMRKILNDLPETEFHAIDSGHFALEDSCPDIADLMRDFLGRVLP
jgi:pimeloyl-ACP methyl ester carboxylesterase